jgi:hypothetical protein
MRMRRGFCNGWLQTKPVLVIKTVEPRPPKRGLVDFRKRPVENAPIENATKARALPGDGGLKALRAGPVVQVFQQIYADASPYH